MKKTLLLTIAALITAWSATAQNHLQFGGGWQTGIADVTYSSDDVINIKISGTGEDEFDRLHLSPGTLTAGGAQLDVFLCSVPTPGDRFEIFKAQSVVGKFSNPQLMNIGGNFFVLSYEKDDAENDLVVLTAVAKIFGLTIKHSDTELDAPDEDRITQWDTYDINVVADPGAGGTVSATQTTCIVCDEITIEATANEGYAFTHWTQEGGAVIANTASPTTTATMPARDVTITAHFEHLLPEAPTADDLTVCYDGAEHSAGATPQLYSSIVWYDDATGTVTTTAPTGTEPNTYKAWAASKHNITGKESEARTEVTLTINALPTMNCPAVDDVCIDDPAFALSDATPTGGTYSGPGVTGSEFNPSVAGVGTHTIVYTYIDSNSCTASCVFTITVNPNNTITHDAGSGGTTQEVCVNIAIAEIKYTTTGADGAIVTGLPAGVTGTFTANVVTISGTPTADGTFNYEIELTGGCGNVTATGTITVNANNTITLSSAANTDDQTVCIDIAIAEITYTTTGATGADVTGLPAGVTGTFSNNQVTISGEPSVAGTHNYTVTMTGGCTGGTNTATGTITVNPLPGAPTALPADGISTNTFTAHWEEVPGAVTYTLDVARDEGFSDFVAAYEALEVVGTTSHTVVGLVSDTTYYYRVKATDDCGPSEYSNTVSVTTSASTAFPCPESITFTYRGDEVTYGVIERGGLCWMDRNLGADPMPFDPAESGGTKTDTRLYGDLFQWGRSEDGHQLRNSSTTDGPTTDPNPGINFITVSTVNYWYSGSNPDDLWKEDGTGANNPCPDGWRVPTEAELNAERESWAPNINATGAFNSDLKWPVGGSRLNSSSLLDVDIQGYVWSSSVSGSNARYLSYHSYGASMSNHGRAFGMSVRCVRPVCDLPPAPEATDATGSTTSSFTANWTEAPGAVTYTLDVALDIDFNTFVDDYQNLEVGDVTSYVVVGLEPSTTYYYRVKVTDDCGTSGYSGTVSVTTDALPFTNCGDDITFTYRDEEVTYGTILIDYGGAIGERCWMDRNLGASRVPTSSTDSQGYGDLFQWGRLDDGHQLRNSSETAGPTTNANPGSNFITVVSGNWYNGSNPDNLWKQDGTGTNNPCPEGWRVPTETELNTESSSWTNSVDAFNSDLKWPVGGVRNSGGNLQFSNSWGLVWSSTVSGSDKAMHLNFGASVNINGQDRARGMSVRCVRDVPDCVIPPPPDATDATGITTSSFTANWDAVPGAVTYTLDVALDDGFLDYVDGFEDFNVGDVTSHPVVGLELSTTYYYRVTATDDCGTSGYSNIVSVTTAELKIGDSHQGGIIAYILQPGDPDYIEGEVHGLIAAPTDQSSDASWGCMGTSIVGTSTDLGTGAANTAAIVAGCSTAGIAARICNDLDLNGYTDWYLPSKDELNKLYINRVAIGGFESGYYWSSSQYSGTYAWSQNFFPDTQTFAYKSYNFRVRAVRTF